MYRFRFVRAFCYSCYFSFFGAIYKLKSPYENPCAEYKVHFSRQLRISTRPSFVSDHAERRQYFVLFSARSWMYIEDQLAFDGLGYFSWSFASVSLGTNINRASARINVERRRTLKQGSVSSLPCPPVHASIGWPRQFFGHVFEIKWALRSLSRAVTMHGKYCILAHILPSRAPPNADLRLAAYPLSVLTTSCLSP